MEYLIKWSSNAPFIHVPQNSFMQTAQKHNGKALKTHKNAETRKKLLTYKNSCASMHKVAEGTTENKATRK